MRVSLITPTLSDAIGQLHQEISSGPVSIRSWENAKIQVNTEHEFSVIPTATNGVENTCTLQCSCGEYEVRYVNALNPNIHQQFLTTHRRGVWFRLGFPDSFSQAKTLSELP